MGVVYEAHDPLLDRTVALKTIELAFSIDPPQRATFEKRFFAEARIAARLSHPNIVIVHDVGRDPETGTLFIALEYLLGQTLAELLKPRVPLDWRRALEILGNLAEGLDHAHRQGVVHRDVKPANVMILPSGESKLMDFGIARIETARMKLTHAGEFFGTPLYMSPEQALGQKVDGRSDLFSVGAIVYEMLTGQLAFGAENLALIIGRVVRDQPPPPSTVIPGLPAEVSALVARLLAKEASDRYADGRTLGEDIAGILAGQPLDGGAAAVYAEIETAPPGPGTEAVDENPLDALMEGGASPNESDAESALNDLVSAAGSRPLRTTAASPTPRVVMRPAAVRPAGPVRHEATRPGALIRGGAIAAGILAVVGVILFAMQRRSVAIRPQVLTSGSPSSPLTPAPPPRPAPATGAPAPRSEATPASESEAVGGARLEVDFEHSLKYGRLRVWIDDEMELEEELGSRVTRKIVVFRKRKGSREDVIEVSPGRHVVTVEVAWDDNVRTERMTGTFDEGVTRRLRARLGGFLRKDLSLEWQ